MQFQLLENSQVQTNSKFEREKPYTNTKSTNNTMLIGSLRVTNSTLVSVINEIYSTNL